MKHFDKENKRVQTQFQNIHWLPESGISPNDLRDAIEQLTQNKDALPKSIVKAKSYELILTKAPIALDFDDVFQDKLFGRGLLAQQRLVWETEIQKKYLSSEFQEMCDAWDKYGAYRGISDYGHTSPNSKALLKLGIPGLLERLERFSTQDNLTTHQRDFYEACKITLTAIKVFIGRLADAIEPYDSENYNALRNLTKGAPSNLYEAMQLLIIYFFVHEFIGGTRVRTLGRLDVLLYPFYTQDINSGTYTKEECVDLLKFFLNKFWSAKIDFDLPFALGGIDSDGREVTNELSYLIVETYNALNIHSPKIHIRVSQHTPVDFIKLVLKCIRGGNSSFVFVNDSVAIESLMRIGIEEHDARNYVPIGCYEPAVWGVEVGCTGNGGVNLAKAIEYVITNGIDLDSGDLAGVQTGEIHTYAEFVNAVKHQIRFMTERSVDYVTKIERYYDQINPDPILSSLYDFSVETGVDLYEGGAKYNNSSMYFHCIASLVDSMAAIKKIVFDEQLLSFDEFSSILKHNWDGHESLRHYAQTQCEKYGNNTLLANQLAREMSNYVAELTNNHPNGRHGVFKAALFSIDYCFFLGSKTMATPDGRYKGDPLSKNLCASTAMDRNGITALIQSVTNIDHASFPTGSVLDFILHPSAVQGEDGLNAFWGLIDTYFKKGGFAIHGNIFRAEDLKAAQKNPEKYRNLQVRVCGWNAYFVNLTKTEQDSFIRQAEINK